LCESKNEAVTRPARLLADLKKNSRIGIYPECHLFWGGFLSQWLVSSFVIDGVNFPTAEHYMMAEKAKTFGDTLAYEKIMNTEHPRSAKEIGRSVQSYDDSIWAEVRYAVVVAGNIAKFTQNNHLRKSLLDTGRKTLVEASPVDTVWGIGLHEDNPKATNPLHWKGSNLLGFALMDVRDKLFDD